MEMDILGCMCLAIVDKNEIQAAVGVYRQGVVGRVLLDKEQLKETGDKRCGGEVSPVSFHQHEFARDLPLGGKLNLDAFCRMDQTGGHHDPGFACGETGAIACRQLDIPPSSALKGTPWASDSYRCTPEVYRQRPFACHAGDISGKVGPGVDALAAGAAAAAAADFRLLALDLHADNPCVAANNQHSLVIHCKKTHYPLACARFERVETAGERLPLLLRGFLKAAALSVSFLASRESQLGALILVHELEKRIKILERAIRLRQPHTQGKETQGKETQGKETQEKETTAGKETQGKETQEKETTARKETTAGKETEGKETEGKETTAGKETEGQEIAEKETTAGKETEGKETPGKETEGKGTGDRETAGKETGEKETAGKETAGKETGEKETARKETAGKGTAGKEIAGTQKETAEKETAAERQKEKRGMRERRQKETEGREETDGKKETKKETERDRK
ncbi:hypothetical protein, conserved [Eimeria brunetti]|uniref:Uncharacterized protein n=1 Tax=Eimeria brunetti TaxID=51314 RepID=U6LMY5_9EIME|nr:hypothetical protein, conserved [Eimeria brunetti]